MSDASNNELIEVLSSDESSSSDADMEVTENDNKQSADEISQITPEEALMRRAEMYQEYMKLVPIPRYRGSVIPFTSWMGLGKSVKQLYGQPLHYLTNILLKQWDQQRIGSEDEYKPLDSIMHPLKAEANIWLIEEIHRKTASPHHVAKLWLSDPMYHVFIDSIFPKLQSNS